jgi:hypothetical protein
MSGWFTLAGLGLSLFQGFRGAQSARRQGQAGYQQGVQNAQDALYFGQLNRQAQLEAAGHNAHMAMAIGELNAGYIERAGERNLKLYGIQSAEELRRHVLAEKMTAGQIRAMQSGTGIQVNTGSNLHYLNDQIDEGLNQRHFMMVRHAETKKSIRMDFEDRAYVERESARLQAETIMANGAIAADMALQESQYQYRSYMRDAQSAQYAGQQKAFDTMLGTIGTVLPMFGKTTAGTSLIGSLGKLFNFTQAPAGPAAPTYISSSAPSYRLPNYTWGWSNQTASNFMGTI